MLLARKQLEQNIRFVPSGNHHRHPGGINFSGRFNFADHPSGSQSTGDLAGISFGIFIDARNGSYQFGILINPRVPVKKAVNVGEIDQQIRIHQQGDHGRQIVIVSQFYFFHPHGVVLINNRNHLP